MVEKSEFYKQVEASADYASSCGTMKDICKKRYIGDSKAISATISVVSELIAGMLRKYDELNDSVRSDELKVVAIGVLVASTAESAVSLATFASEQFKFRVNEDDEDEEREDEPDAGIYDEIADVLDRLDILRSAHDASKGSKDIWKRMPAEHRVEIAKGMGRTEKELDKDIMDSKVGLVGLDVSSGKFLGPDEIMDSKGSDVIYGGSLDDAIGDISRILGK